MVSKLKRDSPKPLVFRGVRNTIRHCISICNASHYLGGVDADALEETGNILLKNICLPPQSNG